jgi:hypothetical protein
VGGPGSGRRADKPPKVNAASLERFLSLAYFTKGAKVTETDCKRASIENARLLASGVIDHRQAEAFDKMIRTSLQCVGREFATKELRTLEDMERRAEARERTAQNREAKSRQRRDT